MFRSFSFLVSLELSVLIYDVGRFVENFTGEDRLAKGKGEKGTKAQSCCEKKIMDKLFRRPLFVFGLMRVCVFGVWILLDLLISKIDCAIFHD